MTNSTTTLQQATATAPAVAADTLPGKFSKDRFGFSMPADGSYYQSPPFYYRGCRALTIVYETDPEIAADYLPEGLELPLPATAAMFFAEYPFSTFGAYHETILNLSCQWQGETIAYMPQLCTTSVPPLAAGREIWGYEKKIAHIELEEEGEMLYATLERPKGTRLATAMMRRERPAQTPPEVTGSISLRVIPNPEENQPPSLAELILTRTKDLVLHEAWEGPATLSFDTMSELDPWGRYPVRKIIGAYYTVYDYTLPGGKVIKTY